MGEIEPSHTSNEEKEEGRQKKWDIMVIVIIEDSAMPKGLGVVVTQGRRVDERWVGLMLYRKRRGARGLWAVATSLRCGASR